MSFPERPARIGFLLSQLGTMAADSFAAKTKELGITPAEAGVLRIIGHRPGINQSDLAAKLGAAKSRVVALIDSLENAGFAARSRSLRDRRNQELRVTESGRSLLSRLRAAAEAQEAEITDGLDDADRSKLYELLHKLSAAHGLDADVHPGYAPAAVTPE